MIAESPDPTHMWSLAVIIYPDSYAINMSSTQIQWEPRNCPFSCGDSMVFTAFTAHCEGIAWAEMEDHWWSPGGIPGRLEIYA